MIQVAEQITEVVKDIHVRLILWSAFSRVFLFGKVMTYSGFHLADRQGALRLFQNLLPLLYATHDLHSDGVTQTELRSEERRVGKECRARRSRYKQSEKEQH